MTRGNTREQDAVGVVQPKRRPQLTCYGRISYDNFLMAYNAHLRTCRNAGFSVARMKAEEDLTQYLDERQLRYFSILCEKDEEDLKHEDVKSFLDREVAESGADSFKSPLEVLKNLRLRYYVDERKAVATLESYMLEKLHEAGVPKAHCSYASKEGRVMYSELLAKTLPKKQKEEFFEELRRKTNPNGGETQRKNPVFQELRQIYLKNVVKWFAILTAGDRVVNEGTLLDPVHAAVCVETESTLESRSSRASTPPSSSKHGRDSSLEKDASCWKCGEAHMIRDCPKFANNQERRAFMRERRRYSADTFG